MPKYRVLGNCTLVCTMDVIADSGDEAIEIANDETCPRCRCVFVACEIDSYKVALYAEGVGRNFTKIRVYGLEGWSPSTRRAWVEISMSLLIS